MLKNHFKFKLYYSLFVLIVFYFSFGAIYAASSYFELSQVVTVTNSSDSTANNMRISLNIGNDSFSPYSKVSYKKIDPNPNEYYEDEFGNKYAVFSKINLAGNSSMSIKITRVIQNNIPIQTLKDNKNYTFTAPENMTYLLNPQTGIESNNDKIIAKSNSLVKSNSSKYDKIKKYFEFVNTKIAYDDSQNYANKGSISALENLKGVCEDYSALFVALCRAQTIPSRIVTGYKLSEDIVNNLNLNQTVKLKDNGHAWPEVYSTELGFSPIEPTFTLLINGKRSVYKDGLGNPDLKLYIPLSLYNIDKSTVDISYSYLGIKPVISTNFDSDTTIRKVDYTYEITNSTFMNSTAIVEPTVIEEHVTDIPTLWDNLLSMFKSIIDAIKSLFIEEKIVSE